MSSSLVLLVVVVCVLVFSPCVSGSASYTLYSDSGCTNQVASGSGLSVSSINSIVSTQCFTVSGVAGVASAVVVGAAPGSTITGSALSTYAYAGCENAVSSYSAPTSSTGTSICTQASYGSGSAKFTINNGAGHKNAILGIPILLLLLAGLLMVIM